MHLEAFMHSLHLELPEELQVHDIYQSVWVHSAGLVEPQQCQVSAVFDTLRPSKQDALNNTENHMNMALFIQ